MAISINGVTVAGIGAPGKDGRSAYDAAKLGGFTGTEQEFNEILASIGNINTLLDEINGEVI